MPTKRMGGMRRWMVYMVSGAVFSAALLPWFGGMIGRAQAGGGGAVPQAAPEGQAGEPGVPRRPSRDPSSIMDRAADSGAQVFVDDSFASVDQIRKALLYARQGQAQLAIRTFQEVIDKYGQKLVYLNDNSYVSITDYVHEQLLQLPAVKDGLYDQMYGGDAQREIDTAVQEHDAATLIRACDRYFPSTAAFKGLAQAADWYFERGEFSAASRLWQQLLVHPLATKNRAPLLFHAATAEALARNGAAAQRLRAQLAAEAPDASAVVDGASVKLLTRLDEILAMAPWEAVDLRGNEWPAFGGGPSRAGLLAVDASIGARLWSVPLVEDDKTAAAPQQRQVNALVQQRAMVINGRRVIQEVDSGLGSFPVLSNGDLFIHDGDRILCLSANAGTLLWSYPPPSALVAHTDANAEMQIRYGGMVGRPSTHDSVAVDGNQVFAVLPAAGGGERAARSTRGKFSSTTSWPTATRAWSA